MRLPNHRKLFGNTGDGAQLQSSFITRSSSLRRSLKEASQNSINKPPIKIVINNEEDKLMHHRKESTHSTTSV